MNQSRTEPGQSMEEILASIRRIIAEGEREAQEAGGQGGRPDVAAMAQPDAAAAAGHAEAGQAEVLVLTEMVQDDGSVVSLPPAAPVGEEPQDAGPGDPIPAAFAEPEVASQPFVSAAVAIETVQADSATEIVAQKVHADIFAAMASGLAPNPDPTPPALPERAESPSIPTPSPDKERIPVSAEGSKKPELVSEEALAASTAALSQLAHSVSRTREPTPGQSKTVEDLVREAVEPMLKQWLDTNLPRIVERMVREAIDRVVRRVE